MSDRQRAGAQPWGPPTAAPLDHGWDSTELAQALLWALPALPRVHFEARTPQLPRGWCGRVSVRATTGVRGGLSLTAGAAQWRVDPAAVLAVSYCADDGASGIRFIDDHGLLLAFWTSETAAFDHWLETLLQRPGLAGSGRAH